MIGSTLTLMYLYIEVYCKKCYTLASGETIVVCNCSMSIQPPPPPVESSSRPSGHIGFDIVPDRPSRPPSPARMAEAGRAHGLLNTFLRLDKSYKKASMNIISDSDGHLQVTITVTIVGQADQAPAPRKGGRQSNTGVRRQIKSA